MSIHSLKPWTELVKLHPDVESGSLTEAVFAIDLGAVATREIKTPMVYRDPDAFFGATYLTKDLRRVLEEVLASLAGHGNYNRVLSYEPLLAAVNHIPWRRFYTLLGRANR